MPKQAFIEICEDAAAEARAIARHPGATQSFVMKKVTTATLRQSRGTDSSEIKEIASPGDDIRVLVFKFGN
ncbi:MAG: hypothetical protein AAF674_20605 [Pseudomonadota bacterium]